MSRDLNHMSTFDLDCPTCGTPMEVIDRFILWGLPSDVEHVKVKCAVGHWFTLPTDSLTARLTSPGGGVSPRVPATSRAV